MVGRPNVGKSTLTNSLIGEKIAIMSDRPQTTRNKIMCIMNTDNAQIMFLDTPGIHKPQHKLGEYMVRTAESTLQEVDVVLFVVDATEKRGAGEDYILNLLVIRKETQTTENLSELRKQIDECDNNLMQELAKRMRVAREIGTFKKEHDMTILQTGRYNEILDKRGSQGVLLGVDSEFIKKVFELIHEESVRQQMEIINK